MASEQTMTARQLGGAIRRAKTVFVYVSYNDDDGVYISVPKSSARLIVDRARDCMDVDGGRILVAAHERSGDLYIG